MSDEPSTQYDVPTQAYDLMDLDDEVVEENEQAQTPKKKEPWARLISKSPEIAPVELFDQPEVDGRLNCYTLGRSASSSVQFNNSARISNKHCIIFCKYNRVDPTYPYLEAWIEDTSANGTYINSNTRLKKNVPRLLHSGDDIYLINPEQPKGASAAATASPEEIAKNSFLLMLYLPSVKNISKLTGSTTLSRAINDVMATRTSTVVRLLGEGRNIHEHYEIKELLGTGTSGRVFHGVHKETGRDWAIKTMDTRKLAVDSSVTAEDLTKEAEMLRSLRHPGIIHLEDIFADGHDLHLVMELSDGGDLFDRISFKGRYPENEAKEVTRQIVAAIKYLHDNKVAHRDLKPENILLVSKTNDTHVKITDFGLAKKVDDSNGGMKTFCGTPQYFAPEVASRKNTVKGQGRYSIEADMWSVGVILYVLLCGAFPFQEKGLFTHIKKAAYSFQSPVWAEVSEEAKDLIRKLLVVSAKERFTAAQTLNHPWLAGSDGSTTMEASTAMTAPTNNKRKKADIAAATPDSASKKKQQAHAVASHNIKEYFSKAGPVTVDLNAMELDGETTNSTVSPTAGDERKKQYAASDAVGKKLTMPMEVVDLSTSRSSTMEDYSKGLTELNQEVEGEEQKDSQLGSSATMALSMVKIGSDGSMANGEGSVDENSVSPSDGSAPKKARKTAGKTSARSKVTSSVGGEDEAKLAKRRATRTKD